MLIREKRLELAHKIFNFIPSRVELDLLDWHDIDIFSLKNGTYSRKISYQSRNQSLKLVKKRA